MKIKELTIQAFTSFCENSSLSNYMQSEEYARFMGENKYNYDYVGLVDEDGVIRAASLILIKRISFNMKYGYAPKGFLINYYDEKLVREFIKRLKEFYVKRNVVFIKVNPEIVVSEIDTTDFSQKLNPNIKLKKDFEEYGFIKLKDNLYFESIEPRFNAYIDLKNTKFNDFTKPTRNKINNSLRKGLYIEKGNMDDLDLFTSSPLNKDVNYYKKLYSIFSKTNKIDIILVKVNYEEFIKGSQELYEKEENNNNLLNEILHRSHKKSDLNRKMASDALLCTIKNDIIKATEGLRDNNNVTIAAAILIRDNKRIHIFDSVYDKKYSAYNANYFMYYKIIEEAKKGFTYLDLGGVSGDFKESSPYYGLNRFKTSFNSKIYEYIGEYDLVLNRSSYEYLKTSGKLNKEFNKDINEE